MKVCRLFACLMKFTHTRTHAQTEIGSILVSFISVGISVGIFDFLAGIVRFVATTKRSF